MSDRRDVEARTRSIFREINEQVSNLHERFGLNGDGGPFVCECGNSECTRALVLSPAEYEAVRDYGRRFVVAPDHKNPEIERVVNRNRRFAVVETFVGQASRIGEETDPRVLTASS